MKILTRYVVREHIGPLFFSLSALTALLLLNQVAKQFGNLVGKGLSWGVIGEFFLLSIPFIIAMTLPMAVLVATLYAFSRLASENEVTALRATGVSINRLVRPVLVAGAVLGVFMLGFNDQLLPRANHRLRTLQTDIARKKPTFALREQVINEVAPGRIYLRTGHIDQASDKLREVTIWDFGDPLHRRTIYADSGRMGLTPDRRDLQMTLFTGYSYEIARETPEQLQRVRFKNDLIRVRGVANAFETTQRDDYKSEREMSICEMETQRELHAKEVHDANAEFTDAIVRVTRNLVTGTITPPPTRPTYNPPPSAAGIYCATLGRLSFLHPIGAADTVDSAGGQRSPPPAAPEVPAAPRHFGPPGLAPASVPASESPANAPAADVPAANVPSVSRPPVFGPPAKVPPANVPSASRPRVFGPPATLPPAPIRITPHRRAGGPGGTGPSDDPALAKPKPVAPSAGAAVTQAPFRAAPVDSVPGRPFRAFPEVTPASALAQLDVMHVRSVDALQSQATYAVEIHKKFALAAACVVMVLFGAPIALRFPSGGVGLVIGISMSVFAIYYVGLIAGEALADKLIIDPALSMWMANIVFGAIGLIFLWRVQRYGATTRGGDLRELGARLRDAVVGWGTRRRRAPVRAERMA